MESYIPCSCIRNFNTVNILYPANRFNAISIKIPGYFVKEID